MTPPHIPIAYVDSSAIVAIARFEPSAAFVVQRLAAFSGLVSSNLLEAEVRSVFARERQELDTSLLQNIEWIFPNRSLSSELAAVLQAGYLRGADLWHVPNALYAARTMPGLAFITLDQRQQAVAASLGFST